MENIDLEDFLTQTLHPPATFTPQTYTLNHQIQIRHLDIGIFEVIPPQVKAALVISSGIHGNETAPIELVNNLVQQILNEQIIPKARCLFIIAHPKAIKQSRRFVDENLNRLFSNKDLSIETKEQEITEEYVIAKKLKRYLTQFYSSLPNIQPWHFDLHSTIRESQHYQFAVLPSSVLKDSEQLCDFFHRAKLDATLLSQTPSNTFSWWSGEYFNALAATVEIGRVKPLYQNDMNEYVALQKTLTALIEQKELPKIDSEHKFNRYKVSRTLTKHNDSFAFAFADDLANFSFFEQGELIAMEDGKEICANKGGEAVVFPNPKVTFGQRAALLVKTFNA